MKIKQNVSRGTPKTVSQSTGKNKKPLIIAAITVVLLLGLAGLLFFTDTFVGKAIEFTTEVGVGKAAVLGGTIEVEPGVTEYTIPIQVSLPVGKKSVAFQFALKHDYDSTKVDYSRIIEPVHDNFFYEREGIDLTIVNYIKSTDDTISVTFAGLCSETNDCGNAISGKMDLGYITVMVDEEPTESVPINFEFTSFTMYDLNNPSAQSLVSPIETTVTVLAAADEEGPSDALCSNGVTEALEECDDGNTENNDGCSDICQIEDGWTIINGEYTRFVEIDNEKGENYLLARMYKRLQDSVRTQDLIDGLSIELKEFFVLESSEIVLLDSCTPRNGWEEGTVYKVTKDLDVTDLDDNNRCFEPDADNIVIDCQGHSITGPGERGTGISLQLASSVTVKNCKVSGFINGAFISWDRPEGTPGSEDYISIDNILEGNNFINNMFGVKLERTTGNSFDGNTFCDNTNDDVSCPPSATFPPGSSENMGSGNFFDTIQSCPDGWPTITDYSSCSESPMVALQDIELGTETLTVLIVEDSDQKQFLENVYTTLKSDDSMIIKLTKIAYYLSEYAQTQEQ